jgi:voltage-gated potassium channel
VKSLGFILNYLATAQSRRNARVLGGLLLLLVVIVAVYSTIFHVIMENEGQTHSWPTAVYWTLVTMSTLGFGDITFTSDTGRLFSVVVLMSGSAFILVLLPFTFIQFVFVPWMEARERDRAPRRLPDDLRDHVLLTGIGPIEEALIERLDRASIPYYALVAELQDALKLHDEGFKVMVGPLDDPQTFRNAGADRAALVAATLADTTNTNIAFTVQEIADEVPLVATANSEASVDILHLAGCDTVLQLGVLLGEALARRVLAPDGRSRVIGEFGKLLIAEAQAPPAMVGRPLSESGLRAKTGLVVGGVWDKGKLEVARPTTVPTQTSTFVLAGTREDLDAYDDAFATRRRPEAPVIIIGGGRVGRAAGRALAAEGMDYWIIEQQESRVRDPAKYVVGDAAELSVLERAGIHETPSVIVTTHDDDINVYLTIYCRRLRPDVQIISRARLDRNVSTLHRAGADAVLSYAATGANAMWNLLSDDNTLQLALGLDVFKVPVPRELVGRTIEDSHIRDETGCTVVGVVARGNLYANPKPDVPLTPDAELVLIGDDQSERRFLARFPSPTTRGRGAP